MNRLVKELLGRVSVLRLATQGETASFDLLRDALGETLLTGTEWDSVLRNEATLQTLRMSYLPVIGASDWYAALGEADEIAPAGSTSWRTVMIPSDDSGFGLTAPQDSSDLDLIALFTGSPSNAQVLVYQPSRGSLSQLPITHCGPPSWGVCAPGTCGNCKAYKVWDRATQSKGVECRCPDQAG